MAGVEGAVVIRHKIHDVFILCAFAVSQSRKRKTAAPLISFSLDLYLQYDLLFVQLDFLNYATEQPNIAET